MTLIFGRLVLLFVLFPTVVAAEAFRFNWTVPLSAMVKAKIETGAEDSTATYVVALSELNENEFALEFRDFRFLTLNGKSAEHPRVASQVGPLVPLMANLPTIRLSKDGEYLGVMGLDTMIRRLLLSVPDQIDDKDHQALVRHVGSTKMRTLMQQRSGEIWNLWVGAWAGLDLEAGRNLTGSIPVKILDREISQHILFEHAGVAESDPCCVRIRRTTIIEGSDALRLFVRANRIVGGGNVEKTDPADQIEFVSARSINVTEIVTEPSSLVPRFVSSETNVTLRAANGKDRVSKEKKEYWFDWQ